MKYPDFFDKVEKIKMKDPLAEILGTFEDGIVEFGYTEIVKAAGHSCPTLAGSYLMTSVALKELYPNETPIRGNIKLAFPESKTEGVTGVIANVMGNITGATEDMGFKGLNGKFARTNLVSFSDEISCSVRFTRTDNNNSVDITYDPSEVPANPKMKELMGLTVSGKATPEEKKLFGEMWQERVEKILLQSDKYKTITFSKNF